MSDDIFINKIINTEKGKENIAELNLIGKILFYL
jgi:hypothetical protein